jgi:hypothetical protein
VWGSEGINAQNVNPIDIWCDALQHLVTELQTMESASDVPTTAYLANVVVPTVINAQHAKPTKF